MKIDVLLWFSPYNCRYQIAKPGLWIKKDAESDKEPLSFKKATELYGGLIGDAGKVKYSQMLGKLPLDVAKEYLLSIHKSPSTSSS